MRLHLEDLLEAYDSHVRLAAGYRMAGSDELARKAAYASQALQAAYNAVAVYRSALAAAQAAAAAAAAAAADGEG